MNEKILKMRRENTKRWKTNNPDKVREQRARYRERNKDRIREQNHKQYLRRKALREEGQRVREKGVEEGERKDV